MEIKNIKQKARNLIDKLPEIRLSSFLRGRKKNRDNLPEI
jgi:hypothetical protein